MVWRSVRAGGDTKTRKSRRTLELPQRRVDALLVHREKQGEKGEIRQRAGEWWQDTDLVFASRTGTELDAANVRRAFRKVTAAAGLNPADWTPRELRHSFVSLLSDAGVPVEKIARLVGHIGTTTTETVYRHQIRPVVTGGAEVMDQLFPGGMAMLGYSVTKGHDSGSVVMASDLVGRTGFEPVTSSVSGKRAPAAPTARDVRFASYDGQLCASRRDYQKFAPHADRAFRGQAVFHP